MSDCGVEGDEVTGTQLSHLLDSTRVFLPVSLISPPLCVKSPRFRFVIVSCSMNLRGGGCKLFRNSHRFRDWKLIVAYFLNGY